MGCCGSKLVDLGDVVFFPGMYVNSVRVEKPSDEAACAATCAQVLSQQHGFTTCELELTIGDLVIRNVENRELILKTALGNVAQLSMEGPKKDNLTIITGDPSGQNFSGHVVKLPKKTLLPTYQRITQGIMAHAAHEVPVADLSALPTSSGGGGGNMHGRAKRTTSVIAQTPEVEPVILQGHYLGKLPVTKPNDIDVAKGAVAEIQRKADKMSSKGEEATILISGFEMRVTSKAAGEVLQQCAMTEVSFSTIISKNIFGYVTCDQNGVMLCHALKTKVPAKKFNITVGAAFKAASETIAKVMQQNNQMSPSAKKYAAERSGSVSTNQDDNAGGGGGGGASGPGYLSAAATPAAGAGAGGAGAAGGAAGGSGVDGATLATPDGAAPDSARALGTFLGTYLGSVAVKKKSGQDTCDDACRILAEQRVENGAQLSSKLKLNEVAIVVSGESIKVTDQISSEILRLTGLGTVTFCTSILDKKVLKSFKGKAPKWESKIMAYITYDEKLRRTICELFATEDPVKICSSISDGFKVAQHIAQLRKKNPFAAFSSTREPIGGPLFALQIHRADLRAVKVCGMGQFGEVYLAKQMKKPGEGDPELGGNYVMRAIKVLKGAASVADRGEFLHEAEMMLKLKHPNLVTLVGVAVQQRPWLTVIEYLDYGDGREALMSAKEKGVVLTYAEQLHMANQVANGMCVIADLGMIHMDLAARNILLGRRSIVKIADFGLTRIVPPGKGYYRLMHTLKLPIKWMALESMVDKIFSTKTDVWGFGITVWECLTYGEIPYGELKNIDVQKFLEDGQRVVQAPHCPLEFHTWLLTCFTKSPRERPTFLEIKKAMADFVAKEKPTAKPIRDIGKTINNWNPNTPWAHPLTEEEVAASLTGEFAGKAKGGGSKKKKKKSSKKVAGADPDAPLNPDSMKRLALGRELKKRGLDITAIAKDEDALRAMLKEAIAKEADGGKGAGDGYGGGGAPAAAAAAPAVAVAAAPAPAAVAAADADTDSDSDIDLDAPTAAEAATAAVVAAAAAFDAPATAAPAAAPAAAPTPTPPAATPTPAAAESLYDESDEESDDSAELSA